jgi:hypothetical protein
MIKIDRILVRKNCCYVIFWFSLQRKNERWEIYFWDSFYRFSSSDVSCQSCSFFLPMKSWKNIIWNFLITLLCRWAQRRFPNHQTRLKWEEIGELRASDIFLEVSNFFRWDILREWQIVRVVVKLRNRKDRKKSTENFLNFFLSSLIIYHIWMLLRVPEHTAIYEWNELSKKNDKQQQRPNLWTK